jgi:pimeloyl-ACP methyl ester carboxylesterase
VRPHLTLAVTAALGGSLLAGPAQAATADLGARPASATADLGARPAAADREPGVGSLRWGACTNPTLVRFKAQCAMLSVPLDYARPSGAKIRLAVSRVRHTAPASRYQGVMLVNPGGPGGSGLVLSVLGGFVPQQAGAAYDWIGFDPRGVGSSRPALRCNPSYFNGPRPDYVPRTRAIEAAWLARSASYALACRRAGGGLLDHVKTTDNARDMDAIRSALGRRQINYYGFSYGTYIGQVYATMFPSRVRRMVLDANIDPRKVWYQANLGQDFAFETVLQHFFAWAARHDSTYHLGTTRRTVERRYYAEQDRLRARPRGRLGPAEWSDAFLVAGYSQGSWPAVASAFAAFARRDDAAPATALYQSADGPGDDNTFAIYLATSCTDARWPRSWSTWRRDNTRVARRAPFLTWANAWFNAPCAFWPARSASPVNVRGRHLPRILLLSETLDAATPYSGSLEVRRRFPSASLIATAGGTTHANSLNGNACVDNRIATYLRNGTTARRLRGSRADVVCAPLPEPTATRAGSARRVPVDVLNPVAR